jgi:hypothetical protein
MSVCRCQRHRPRCRCPAVLSISLSSLCVTQHKYAYAERAHELLPRMLSARISSRCSVFYFYFLLRSCGTSRRFFYVSSAAQVEPDCAVQRAAGRHGERTASPGAGGRPGGGGRAGQHSAAGALHARCSGRLLRQRLQKGSFFPFFFVCIVVSSA